jgi:hypothetical protein
MSRVRLCRMTTCGPEPNCAMDDAMSAIWGRCRAGYDDGLRPEPTSTSPSAAQSFARRSFGEAV